MAASREGSRTDAFIWRHGRAEVALTREGLSWVVTYTTAGRLLGPRQLIYQSRHRRPTHAAWDVMARVIRVCRDETEGLRAAQGAARWMRHTGEPEVIE